MAHRLRAGPHPDASRAQPVFTTCHPCTAGRHQPSAAPSSCERLLNPQTIQLPPAAAASALPIDCTRLPAGPQQPRQGAPRLVAGGTHQRRPAGLPQAAPGHSQGQRRGHGGNPCPLALGDAIRSRDPKTGEGGVFPQDDGGRQRDSGVGWRRSGGRVVVVSVLRTETGLTERNLKGDFEIDSRRGGESGPICAQVLSSQADRALHHWVCPPQRWVVEPVST